jgi:MFS family permease
VLGHASVSLVIAITAMGGLVQVVDSPARQAFISALVPAEDLASAVSLNGVVMNSARVVGPAVAGILIITVGTTPCFAVNAASYLAIVGALALIRPIAHPTSATREPAGVRAGIRYARQHQPLWLPLAMMAVVGLLAFNFAVVLPVFAKDTFHGSGATYGLMSTVLSVGSIAGSLSVGLVRHPRRRYLVLTSAAFGISLAATAAAPTLLTAEIALLVTGAGSFAFVTLCSTSLQLHARPAYRARVMALWVYVFIGTTPIGSVVTGWIIAAAGPRRALVVGAGACAAAAALAARVRTPPNPADADNWS